MRRSALVSSVTAGLVTALVATAPAGAAAKRVVALEWSAVENLTALGVTPVGAADLRGYDAYVGQKRSSKITDVGTRTLPSEQRIRDLEPDLIITTDQRSSGQATGELARYRSIAPVLVMKPYPAGTKSSKSLQYRQMVKDFKATAKAVGKESQGKKVLSRMTRTFKSAKKKLKQRKRLGERVVVTTPGGDPSNPALRLFTDNSLAAEIVRKVGLKNAWRKPKKGAGNTVYGFTDGGPESLVNITKREWFLFTYPEQHRKQIQRYRTQSAFAKLPVVRARRYRNLDGQTWFFGGPLSTMKAAKEISNAVRRGVAL
ncbi:MAG: ABC transporter substrate-binding protein [Solirubrobacteraceae bacterium]|nr:ABC transporter substrate-binding protein [Solirubrobacteraceae bacterium]